LGLAIARQAVWAHDGTVAAESTVGEGTRIVFTVPVRGAVEQKEREEPREPQEHQEERWEST
jgi:signal transduction histidine kinase